VPSTGSYQANAVVFLKGQLPKGAKLELSEAGSGAVEIEMDGEDLADWTPFWLSLYRAWDTANNIWLKLHLTSTNADTFDFEVGPSLVNWSEAYGVRGAYPQWKPGGIGDTTAQRDAASSVNIPAAGSYITSFYVPAFWSESMHRGTMGLAHIGTTGDSGIFGFSKVGGEIYVVFYTDAGDAHTAYVAGKIVAGAVNTAAVVYGAGRVSIYINGASVKETAAELDGALGGSQQCTIGVANWGSEPFLLLASRLDKSLWSADEVADLDAQLRNDGALDVIVPARGRTYRIKSIPSTPLSAENGGRWVGTLELEQVDYDPDLADISTREP